MKRRLRKTTQIGWDWLKKLFPTDTQLHAIGWLAYKTSFLVSAMHVQTVAICSLLFPQRDFLHIETRHATDMLRSWVTSSRVASIDRAYVLKVVTRCHKIIVEPRRQGHARVSPVDCARLLWRFAETWTHLTLFFVRARRLALCVACATRHPTQKQKLSFPSSRSKRDLI